MVLESSSESVQGIRKFTIVQLAVTAAFLAIIFWLRGGTDADYPPIWLIVVLMVAIAAGAFFAERVWTQGIALDPVDDGERNTEYALKIFAGQTVRKLICTEIPLLFAVVMAFVFEYGGWPVLIAAVPGLAVQAFETWPHVRNTSMSASYLESQGAESGLMEGFLSK